MRVNKLKQIDEKALICPFCNTKVEIEDRDINNYDYYDAYAKCPKCDAYAVISVYSGSTIYPVEYSAFANDKVSETRKIYDPIIDKYL